jgi:hypothetical protein
MKNMQYRIIGSLILILFAVCSASAVKMPEGHRGLDLSCETCHTTDSWTILKNPIPFDHNQTSFPLETGHRNVSCVSCHTNGDFVTVQSNCQTCHKDVHHSENGPDCQRCHDARGWIPTQAFDLHQMTRFPLIGVHVTVDCQSCHVNQTGNEFVGTATDCFACHLKDYEDAKFPNHTVAHFDHNCEQCHTVSTPAWKPSTFDHNQTGFVLNGAHWGADCASCHVNGVFLGTPTDCYTCHKLDYEQVRVPNHVTANFEQDCVKCHTETAWAPSTFDHNQTGFELVGGHKTVDCVSCHVNGVFSGTPTDCYTCHKLDYEQVRVPNHVLSLFSVTCLECHTQTAWEPALFDHNKTQFPLTGRHSTTDCANCHTNGVFANTAMACYACHQMDFQNARDPNHVSARFPDACEQCHNTNRWEPAQFDHRRFFPIYSGKHRGEWDTCADCHTHPADFKTFSCLTCHEHSQARMDREHRGRRNYVYESQACYGCHPDGDD